MASAKEFFEKNKIWLVGAGAGVVVLGLTAGLIAVLLSGGREPLPVDSALSSEISAPVIGPADSEGSETDPSEKEESTMSITDQGTTTQKPTSSATVTKSTSGSTTAANVSPVYKEYTKYNLDTWMTPIWKGNVVYNESLMFIPNAKTHEMESAPLLYVPDKILSVRDAALEEVYEEGRDYVVENGCIKLTENSRIASWDYDDYYRTEPASVPIGSVRAPGRYINYAAGKVYAEMQIAVTYTHKGEWSGTKPQYAGSSLSGTITKLKNKQPLTIVYYGDSIMTGCEATSTHKIAPNMPIFTDMVTAKLKSAYGYNNITAYNTAVGGWTSEDGLNGNANDKDHPGGVHERVTKYNPDLVVIGFGMNIGKHGALDQYEQDIRDMIADVRKQNPNAEFLLVSTTLPNPDCNGWTSNQPYFQQSLKEIVKDTKGTALVPMTSIHQYLLQHKRYDDMNGNGVNHPNDFLARVYGQAICQTLIENLD